MKYQDRILEEARLVLRDRLAHGTKNPHAIQGAEDAALYCCLELARETREVFALMLLDARYRMRDFRRVFYGTLDEVAVHPREVVIASLHANAASVVLTHNHPSGDPEPSELDLSITRRLRDALALIDAPVLDHIVVGDSDRYVSFAQRGLL